MEWTNEADGVFRGGGVKGLGLAGALEAFGTHQKWRIERWVNVAGASAGAVIAAYLAYDKTPDVGKRMSALLDPQRLAAFQDFPFHRKYLGGVPSLLLKHGMAPGRAFEKWFDTALGGSTFTIAKTDDDWRFSRLKLIACDVTNHKLLVLPEDLPKYRELGRTDPIDPDKFKISRAARMSMSIPYFFEPIELELVRDEHGERIPPRPATIVDGGTLSNFPVWIFDVAEPKRPTFGFTLRGGSGFGAGFDRYARLLPWLGRFAVDIFHTAQEAWDERFMTHSTKVRTFAVDATVITPDGKPYPVNTTDFELSRDLQEQLIQNGRNAANEFLDRFDVRDYMNTLHAALPVVRQPTLAPTP